MRTAVAISSLFIAIAGCKDKPPATHDDAPMNAADGPTVTGTLACTPTAGSTVNVRKITTVSGGAMLATSPPGDPRLFIVEQNGRIRIFDSELRPTAFLDITNGNITAGGEQGLLGLAFHPQYATNHQFYIFYTTDNANIVTRYTTMASDPNVADPASEQVVLSIPDFASNHNGGMIEFGGDGMLYIGTGDGGGGGDPQRNGQNRNALLAKMLRLDVDHPANGKNYGIPTDNPFADGVSGAPEVFIYGLRNPWRWSFDRGNGDMWIGDVGQGQLEEIDVLPAGQQSGKNLGWSMYEGTNCCKDAADKCTQSQPFQDCDPNAVFNPQDQRTHDPAGWRAIIGGQVYRGACFTDLVGWYFYTDNSKHQLVKARQKADKSLELVDVARPGGMQWPGSPASLHADARGELFMTTTSGDVFMIEAGP